MFVLEGSGVDTNSDLPEADSFKVYVDPKKITTKKTRNRRIMFLLRENFIFIILSVPTST